MSVRSCLVEPSITEGSMGATRTVFEFKCPKGHRSEERYPPGTSYETHGHILCPECLKADVVNRAYLIFACPEKPNAGRS